MTRVSRPLRGRRPTKRPDLTDVRALLHDSRQWTALGIVIKPEDGEHWYVVGDGGDIMVELELQPEQVPVTARLAAGMWMVPDIGDEVAVMLPAGELDWMPVITCILAHSVPAVQGPQPQRIVIVRSQVLIHDGSGGAVELALKSDVEAVDAKYANHLHAAAGAPTTGPLSAYVPGTPPIATPLPSAAIVGTQVLKAK